ncbi:MAG: hypothetical protein GY821_03200 [Gammaproteobacteria bacterium]|nr:hypothetical protein [Gammaproteobacteria bacterium]
MQLNPHQNYCSLLPFQAEADENDVDENLVQVKPDDSYNAGDESHNAGELSHSRENSHFDEADA